MVHFCVVPGCTNSSSKMPHLSFHRLPLKDKTLLKVWIHKIGRKNLPLNSNSRVCSNHFVNSAHRLLRKDEYPSKNLPKLATQITPVRRRPSPKRRLEVSFATSLGLSDDVDIPSPPVRDATTTTELTGDHVEGLNLKVTQLNQNVASLQKNVLSLKFSLENIGHDDKIIAFYTGFPSFESLKACFDFLGPSVHNLIYWNAKCTPPDSKGRGRNRTLPPLEEFFMVLVRLRLGLFEQDLAHHFNLSCSTISRIFATWINFLYMKLKDIPLWPPRGIIRSTMSKQFAELYPFTRVILDATEIFIEKPSLPDVQQMTF